MHTPLCDLLDIKYPVVLAGMSQGTWDVNPTPPKLAAAVSEAGGLGVMSCGDRTEEHIEWCIREFRRLSSKPFGVDFSLPAKRAEMGAETRRQAWRALERDYPKHVAFVKDLIRQFNLPDPGEEPDEPFHLAAGYEKKQVQVILDLKVPVFACALGDPAWMVPLAHQQGMKVIGMAGAVRHAARQRAAGVDIVCAQGTEAGGHTGSIATFVLVPQVVDAVKPMPVLAAGGVGTGRHVAAALALGAQGAWVGTAFLASEETQISDVHQQTIIKGASEDFTVSRAFSGKPMRGSRNLVKEAWQNSGLSPLDMPAQGILMGPFMRAAKMAGREDLESYAAGQISGMITKRRPAKEIFDDLVNEGIETIERMRFATAR
ncbi:MAG: nitronate monooxygenase [Chloroflexi bacterium]|nr:nitronate monooxygenase [Chloroflexota bacterium]